MESLSRLPLKFIAPYGVLAPAVGTSPTTSYRFTLSATATPSLAFRTVEESHK